MYKLGYVFCIVSCFLVYVLEVINIIKLIGLLCISLKIRIFNDDKKG